MGEVGLTDVCVCVCVCCIYIYIYCLIDDIFLWWTTNVYVFFVINCLYSAVSLTQVALCKNYLLLLY